MPTKSNILRSLLKKLKCREIAVIQESSIEKSSIGFYNHRKLDIINQKEYLKLKY